MNIKKLQETIFTEYKRNGYLKEWNRGDAGQQKRNDIAELGLVVTEVSEGMEEVREQDTSLEKLGGECADIIIRTVNFMSRKGIDAETAIKNAIAKKR